MTRRLKTITASVLAAVIITTAPVYSYIDAQAAEVAAAYSVLESLLLLLNIDLGLGYQPDFVTNSYDDFSDIYQSWKKGDSVTLGGYGSADLSDADSVSNYFNWVNNSVNADSVLSDNYDQGVYDTMKALDSVSYSNTGTSASNSIGISVSDVYTLDDCDSFFKVVDGGDFEGDSLTWYQKAFGILNCFMVGVLTGYDSDKLSSSFDVAEDTVYTDYDNSTFVYDVLLGKDPYSTYVPSKNDSYFYSFYESGYYSHIVGYYDGGVVLDHLPRLGRNSNYYYFCVLVDGIFYSYSLQLSGSSVTTDSVGLYYTFRSSDGSISNSYRKSFDSGFSFVCPVFNSLDDAELFYKSGLVDDDLLLNKSNYTDFKSNVEGASKFFEDNGLYKYLATVKPGDDLTSAIAPLADAAKASNGTSKALTSVSEAIAVNSGVADDTVDDTEYDTSDILSTIKSILTVLNKTNSGVGSIVSAVVTSIPLLLNSVISILKDLPDNLVAAYTVALPGILTAALISVFPNADLVFEHITGMPTTKDLVDTLADAFPFAQTLEDTITYVPLAILDALPDVLVTPLLEGIAALPSAIAVELGGAIVIPDIIIPDITIPDIVVPEITIPEIAIPDVTVYPSITLDPAYDITVANDYDGLADIISESVAGVLDDVFIPDEASTLEKVGKVGDYFKIKDDVQDAVGQFKDFLFGITPSPILKIPIGSPTSKKYKYGFGDYFIIDISWYSTYKDYGDKIILAIAWALFLWRVFLKLPGIISGTEGSIVSVNNSRDNYNDIVYPKKKGVN